MPIRVHHMSSTIAAAHPASQIQTVTAIPPEAAAPEKGSTTKTRAQPSAATTAGSSAQQQAALNKMLATYARDISRGVDAGTVSNLGKQIMVAAKALGQHVTLPHAPAGSGAASATTASSAPPAKGVVNVTA
jgi:hypothetical protein